MSCVNGEGFLHIAADTGQIPGNLSRRQHVGGVSYASTQHTAACRLQKVTTGEHAGRTFEKSVETLATHCPKVSAFSSKRFLPTVVDIWSSELKSHIPVHFSLLILDCQHSLLPSLV